MKIKKKLNNNVIIAVNEMLTEFVLVGNGIAYGKSINDDIQLDCADKIFTTQGKGVAEKLSRIIEDIPLEYVKVCDEIINSAKKQLNENLNEKIYLTLIDHISFAIERHNSGIDISSLLKWEIKKIAPKEYAVGLNALDIIEKRLNIRLPNDEAVYIAFHILDSRIREDDFTVKTIALTRQILEIVKSEFDVQCDENYQPYNRFLIHLQYLARRIFKQDMALRNDNSLMIYEKLKYELPKCYRCVCMIEKKIDDEYDFKLNENEKAYLMIHLHNLIS
ncbi:PRD domain-containing protein [Traorella massiliensis]|uniref:PRD domain-containing protein n=1 Tax=Traorella massiliensis TaxID=1903263 RepID=UPI0008F8FECF|nr:PRD domain-containing protein [Traorella massiliensis]